MGILEEFLNESLDSSNNEAKNKSDYSEEEMDSYGLEESEKELVRKGEYNPWDFETEGPFEEDDYYSEDE